MNILIGVRAKSNSEEVRTITVSDDGKSVFCDCDGYDGIICSHIDAVLIAKETAMLAPGQEDNAKRAAAKINPKDFHSEDWKGSWRRDMVWRGLGTSRAKDRSKPYVCFTGTLKRKREDMMKEAAEKGWEVTNSASASITVLVAEDPNGTSGKIKMAKAHGIPVITSDEWTLLISQ